jgi:GMP synthase (glutamine-hydrolysing)
MEKPMKILQVQHLARGFDYNCKAFFQARGDVVENVEFCRGQVAPDPDGLDAAIVYGGSMSAYDDKGHPWIGDELRYLEACLKAGLPVLGICLGSQLLARLLGARVYPSPRPEFGFYRIRPTALGLAHPVLSSLCAGRESDFLALEWHNDAWDLPSGARLLAGSETWPNQAFSYGEGVLATQFHLEFTQAHMAAAVAAEPEGIPRGPGCEDPAAFVADPGRFAEIGRNMACLLAGFLGQPRA